MSNILTEQRVSLRLLAEELMVHRTTLWRWCSRGIRGITLETYYRGGRRFTSREAVDRFFEGVTAASTPASRTTPNHHRLSNICKAEQVLREAGL
jgi:hypothetical protein